MPTLKKGKKEEGLPPEECRAEGKKYSTEKLLQSKHLAGYQPDFAKVILTKPAYSISEAKSALDKALKGGK